MNSMLMRRNHAPFTRTLLAIAISLSLVPTASYAALKPSYIKDLPQTGEISTIRAGKFAAGIAVFAWQGGDQVYAQRIQASGVLSSGLEELDGFEAIEMDDDGDFLVETADYTRLTVQNSDGDSIEIKAAQTVNTYDFGEGKNGSKSVTFQITDPVIKRNAAGDFVVIWEETKTDTTRKPHKTCYTDEYGDKYCYSDGYRYATSPTLTLRAQRYNSNMTAKDDKPLLVAQARGAGRYIDEVAVVMDADGDFTVAYTAGKTTDKTRIVKNEYGDSESYEYTVDNSDVFVRQFATNQKAKFSAGKAVRVSAKPKMPFGHKSKNVTHKEPSIVVTDETTNAFIIMWHNDYEDHYKESSQEYACIKYKTRKYDGDSYKECVQYGYKTVFEAMSDNASILKAKRYTNK